MPQGHYTDQCALDHGHCNGGQGLHCGVSTAHEVFLIFTTDYTTFNALVLQFYACTFEKRVNNATGTKMHFLLKYLKSLADIISTPSLFKG